MFSGACRMSCTATMFALPPVQEASRAPNTFHASECRKPWKIAYTPIIEANSEAEATNIVSSSFGPRRMILRRSQPNRNSRIIAGSSTSLTCAMGSRVASSWPNTPSELRVAHSRYISTMPGTNLNSFQPVVRSSTISRPDSPSRTPSISTPSVITGNSSFFGEGEAARRQKNRKHRGTTPRARRDHGASDGVRSCEVPGGRRAVIELCRRCGREVAVLRGGAAHCGGERPLRGPVIPLGDRLHQRVLLEERASHQQLADELDGERQHGGAVRIEDDVRLSIDHETDEEKPPLRGDR